MQCCFSIDGGAIGSWVFDQNPMCSRLLRHLYLISRAAVHYARNEVGGRPTLCFGPAFCPRCRAATHLYLSDYTSTTPTLHYR